MSKKKQVLPKNLSAKKKMEILEEYMDGAKVKELAESHNMSIHNMDKFIGRTCKRLNIVRETNALVNAQLLEEKLPEKVSNVRVSYNNPKLINEEFLALLSDEGATALSEAEQLYCVMYAQTGNNKKAIQASGLDAGIKTKEMIQMTVDHAMMLRGFYLRNRPQIASAVSQIQDKILKDLNISKDYVQTNLIQSIEELKEEVVDNPRVRSHLLKSIELLGKTIGAFQENINVTQVDANEAMQELINMAKNEAGTYESK
jgi:hypothetical protein